MLAAITSQPVSWNRYTATAAFLIASVLLLLWRAVRHRPVLSFLFIAGLLFTGGLLLSGFGFPLVNERFSSSLGDAMMIAALLGLTVDYFLKERVLREISGDVSKYLIGYRLPTEVQDRIRWLLQTEWIRRNFHVRCRLIEIDPSRVSLEITISEEIQNITSEPSVYQDFLEFERHDPTTVIEMRCDCDEQKSRYRLAGADLQAREKADDPGVMQVLGKKIKIPPVHEAIGRTYNLAVRYVVEYPSQYSESINFSHATINVILEAETPENYQFTTSGADVSGHNRWEFRRLFLPGESITFRWRRL